MITMKRRPRYVVLQETTELVLIEDVGPWNKYPTVTNGAEDVVEELAPLLAGRRLEYFDSDGVRGELLVREGRFAGFAPVKEVK